MKGYDMILEAAQVKKMYAWKISSILHSTQRKTFFLIYLFLFLA